MEKSLSDMSVEQFNQTVNELVRVYNKNVACYGNPLGAWNISPILAKQLTLGKKKFRGYDRAYRNHLKYIAVPNLQT